MPVLENPILCFSKKERQDTTAKQPQTK